MDARVVLVDYGAGNLLSVARAFRHLGANVALAETADAVAAADCLVLPGVGAFAACMDGLRRNGLDEAVRRHVEGDKPFLGICVGMQMLFEASDEFGDSAGLGLFSGRVRAIPSRDSSGRTRKIPHIGWNGLRPARGLPAWSDELLAGIHPGESVYFVHSFAVEAADPACRLAECDYEGLPLLAAVRRGRAWGVQFHPEKSGPKGLRMLSNFLIAAGR